MWYQLRICQTQPVPSHMEWIRERLHLAYSMQWKSLTAQYETWYESCCHHSIRCIQEWMDWQDYHTRMYDIRATASRTKEQHHIPAHHLKNNVRGRKWGSEVRRQYLHTWSSQTKQYTPRTVFQSNSKGISQSHSPHLSSTKHSPLTSFVCG